MFRLDTSHPSGAQGWTTPPFHPEVLLVCNSRSLVTSLYRDTTLLRTWTDPLEALSWMPAHLQETPAPARWVGFLGYDLGQLFERLPRRACDDLHLPLFAFGLCRTSNEAAAFIPTSDTGHVTSPPVAPSNFTRPRYEAAVARAIDYIRAGDIFQVNLSQRLTRPVNDSPAAIYARLLANTPAHYGGFLDFPQTPASSPFTLISNSPELFLHLSPTGLLTTRPIKGTRPRLPGQLEALAASEKDKAELAMIVDLHRNDLGRVCTVGSVKVTEARIIEAHPTVYQGVATVQGQLKPGLSWVDLLRGTFPAGSVTGAPKIRAMEIIDELEPTRRGPYCGAIGYLDKTGDLQFNVAIRTMLVQAGQAHIPVGGGIVADSTPASEYEETMVKARALLASLES